MVEKGGGGRKVVVAGGGLFGDDRPRSQALMMAALMGFAGYPAAPGREPEPKRLVKCLLPGCEVLTMHPGGYCKAEHCREHRRLLRAARERA